MDYKMQSLKKEEVRDQKLLTTHKDRIYIYRHIGWKLGKYKLHDQILKYNIGLHRIVFKNWTRT
jgi:hypothetical protein